MPILLLDILSETGMTSLDQIGETSEFIALTGLAAGTLLAVRELRSVLDRSRKVEQALGAATGAFQTLIEQYFDKWGLSAAERDVALLSIKGIPLADIARMRNTREGTIKAQNASIYRKARVSSRAELVTLVIEDLVVGLALPGVETPAARDDQR